MSSSTKLLKWRNWDIRIGWKSYIKKLRCTPDGNHLIFHNYKYETIPVISKEFVEFGKVVR